MNYKPYLKLKEFADLYTIQVHDAEITQSLVDSISAGLNNCFWNEHKYNFENFDPQVRLAVKNVVNYLNQDFKSINKIELEDAITTVRNKSVEKIPAYILETESK